MKNLKLMKDNYMNSIIKSFTMLFSLGIICPLSFATTIEIKNKSCEYTVQVTSGWDTIPRDTLNNRFGIDVIDIGLYYKDNETYFEGEYMQFVFLPTVKSLNNFSFKQIVKDFKGSVSQTNNQSKVDSIYLLTHDFIVSEEQMCLYIYGTVKSDLKERSSIQAIIPAKFGFLKIIYYGSINEPKNENNFSIQKVVENTKICGNYSYSEPLAKSKLTIWHFVLAFCISFIVYVIIQYMPKLKQLLSK